jgi:hypothetical protein
MNETALSRLERANVREVWASESANFTPWLAEEDNLKLLGDTIGIELELEAQEKTVGLFRADILCKDLGTGNWVLVENQLERTDHTHLGQLLTYAAGLNAVTVVWVASHFSDDHRAALDWLNEITDEMFNFFGLEIELWRIGNSPLAPKFNAVCKPNNWTKSISPGGPDLTDTQRLQREYWAALRSYILENSKILKPQKPLPQHWTNFAIGRSNFTLVAFANTRDRRIAVGLLFSGDDAKPHYYLLEQDKGDVEEELGSTLEWRELPGQKESRIMLHWHGADPTNRQRWPEQHQWLCEKLETFRSVFGPRVRKLDAGDYWGEGDTGGAGRATIPASLRE